MAKRKSKKQLELESLAINLLNESGLSFSEDQRETFTGLIVLGLSYKKPKKVKDQFPEYTDFTRIWHENYYEIGFVMPRDGAKIKSIILQTRQYISNGGHQPTAENCILLWEAFIKSLPKTWAHGKNLSVIESQYLSLIWHIKNGTKQINGYHSKNSADRFSDFADTGT